MIQQTPPRSPKKNTLRKSSRKCSSTSNTISSVNTTAKRSPLGNTAGQQDTTTAIAGGLLPNLSYKYECEGTLNKESTFDGKYVKWKAVYDRPIEEFLYPSLNSVKHSSRSQTALPNISKNTLSCMDENDSDDSESNTTSQRISQTPKMMGNTNTKAKARSPKWHVEISDSTELKPGSRQAAQLLKMEVKQNFEQRIKQGEDFLRSSMKIQLIDEGKAVAGEKPKRKVQLYDSIELPPNVAASLRTSKELYSQLVEEGQVTKVQTRNVPKAGLLEYEHLYANDTTGMGAALKYYHSLEEKRSRQRLMESSPSGMSPFGRKGSNRKFSIDRKSSIRKSSFANLQEEHRQGRTLLDNFDRFAKMANSETFEDDDFSLGSLDSTKVDVEGQIAELTSSLYLDRIRRALRSTSMVDNAPFTAQNTRSMSADVFMETQAISSFFSGEYSRVKAADYAEDAKSPPDGSPRNESGESSPVGYLHDSDDDGDSSQLESIRFNRSERIMRTVDVDAKRRYAQDLLLIEQLRAGVLPENLLKKVPHMKKATQINLPHHGIGDIMGTCLGKSLVPLDMLQKLDLRDNRLTSKSIPVLLENLSTTSVKYLNLSKNDLHGAASVALGQYIEKNINLEKLFLSNCNIDCNDTIKISAAFRSAIENGSTDDDDDDDDDDDFNYSPGKRRPDSSNWKESFQEDRSTGDHSEAKEVDKHRDTTLDLSYNKISVVGITALGEFISHRNCRLSTLDVSWNQLGIEGAVKLAQALASNNSLTSLTANNTTMRDQGAQCIAASLLSNSTLKELYLSQNGVGEQACFVFSRVIRQNPRLEKLDLSCNPLGDSGARCIFRTILRDSHCFVSMRDGSYKVVAESFNHSNPADGSPYTLDMTDPYDAARVHELISMVESGSGCSIDSVTARSTLESVNESYIPVTSKDKKVILKSSNKKWVPPATGILKVTVSFRYRLPTLDMVLSDESLEILMYIIIHAKSEGDRKNWLALMCADAYFSTAKVNKMLKALKALHLLGRGGLTTLNILEGVWANIVDDENKFDFLLENLPDFQARWHLAQVMTFEKYKFNRMNASGHWRLDLSIRQQRSLMCQLAVLGSVESEFSEKMSRRGDTSQKGNWQNFRNETYRGQEIVIDKEFMLNIPWTGVIEFDYVSTTRPPTTDITTLTSNELENLLYKDLKLPARKKVPKENSIMYLLSLQLAAVKYYFSTADVASVMDCFSNDDSTQVKIIVCLFCRIKDLENMDVLMRLLKPSAKLELVHKLGWLNVMNPLKPTHDFILSQKYYDNRVLTLRILELSANESGDQLKESPQTELVLVQMYATMGRIVSDGASDKSLIVSYCEVGERTSPPNWPKRREYMAYFLLGTHPINPEVYRTIKMYKEMEEAGGLGTGPVDIQYTEYLKLKKEKRREKWGTAISKASNLGSGGSGNLLESLEASSRNSVLSVSQQASNLSKTLRSSLASTINTETP